MLFAFVAFIVFAVVSGMFWSDFYFKIRIVCAINFYIFAVNPFGACDQFQWFFPTSG